MIGIFEPWEKSQGKMTEILEKSGNCMRGKKWEPCILSRQVLCRQYMVEKIFGGCYTLRGSGGALKMKVPFFDTFVTA